MNITQREMPFFPRGEYLDRIKNALQTIPVTVLTGIRRSGKTFLLKEIIADLKDQGIEDRFIIYLDLEKFVFPQAASRKELKQYLASKISDTSSDNAGKKGANDSAAEHFYLFLDEAQVITGWEKVLDSFIEQGNVSIMVALSGTKLGKSRKKPFRQGNWLEITVTPLSYSEYRGTGTGLSSEKTGLLGKAAAIRPVALKLFNDYVSQGGFPATVGTGFDDRQSKLSDIYSAILYHDVITRYDIKNTRLAEMIIKYIFEHLGEECSAGKLVAHFKREKYTKNLSAVPQLVRLLETALVIIRVYRINLATMRVQKAGARYFTADHALFHALYGGAFDIKTPPASGLMANMIVSELRRRDYEVYSGKVGEKIIDFVALKNDMLLCIQTFPADSALYHNNDEKHTALEEARALAGEQYALQQFIVFFDHAPSSDEEGPRLLSLPDFLLCREY